MADGDQNARKRRVICRYSDTHRMAPVMCYVHSLSLVSWAARAFSRGMSVHTELHIPQRNPSSLGSRGKADGGTDGQMTPVLA